MSSKRRLRRKHRRRSCEGKRAWPDEQSAQTRVYRLLRREKRDPMRMHAGYLKAYRCQYCSGWHIGNAKDVASMPIFIDKLVKTGVIPKPEKT